MSEGVTCPKCFGVGYVEDEKSNLGVPTTKPCPCTMAKEIVRNLNRGWVGLSTAPKLSASPLMDHVWDFLHITADDESLRSHLKHVGIRMGWTWGFKVITDSDLMTAWLAPIALSGKEILDPDATSVSTAHATLVDLTEPPDLLVLRLGVKAARNSAMCEVFLETLLHRIHLDRPVWVVEQPTRRLDPSHMCYSEDAMRILSMWEHVSLGESPPPPGMSLQMINPVQESAGGTTPPSSMSLGGFPTTGTGTRRVERPGPKEPKSRFGNKGFKGGDR